MTTNIGTGVTSGGTTNTDGSAVELLSALSHDVHYLVIGIGGDSTAPSGNDVSTLLDILVDPAGGTSWASLIDDLLAGFCQQSSAGNAPFTHWYHFPLFIASGSSIGAQSRCVTISRVNRVGIWAYGHPSRPDMWWCGQKVESLGITAASSQGTDITPNGLSGTLTFTDVGSTTSARYGAIQLGQQGIDNATAANAQHFQIGIGGARIPGTPTFYNCGNTGEFFGRVGWNPIWCDIPQGTQLQVGACSSNGLPEAMNVALYGVH